ncbi:unnamed protein product [Zymoseptoria tritici ST99CH_1A5]|uniref:C2 domain-containing protein n=1 Tax=Zymoseptoria tritici ST99CH_1A5 TaxID=1276529 RepID=A0A1Y6L5Q2_ZYMTR|nr:unnamed protein product [Zymoseptoria tritici ST99CH_1A5]
MSDPAQPHKPGAPWSGQNKIPTVGQFINRLDQDKKSRDQKIDQQVGGDVVPHKNETKQDQEGQKTVTDPTTGKQVTIENVNDAFVDRAKNPVLSVPNANLGKDTPVKTEATQSNPEYKYKQDITAPPDPVAEGTTSDVPIHGEKTNILFHPTPSVSYEATFARLEERGLWMIIGVFFAIIILGRTFGGKYLGIIPLAACVSSGIWLWIKEVVRSGREVEWSSEKERGRTATANLLPESVEWMNTLLGIVWGLVNPDMFQAVADTLEDVMQASVPGVIENVRVAEIDQGSNPIRILSLRALPDDHVEDIKKAVHEENKKNKDPQEAAADEEGGDYYNLEVSFAYHAEPSGKRASEKARNMHMQLVFYLGIKGLFGVPLPIWVELQSLVGTVRLRMAMTPQPPFLKTLTFTLMGVPQVSAGCTPMIKAAPNILNLPLISQFVNYAIGAAAGMYVAPKSMSLDMRAMLQGDDITKDTQALGILWIRIHKATDLSKQDRKGSKHGGSDPYITLAFSKYGKPQYCTRVITDDLNPVWEETAGLLVTPELIKADENLSVELWDSDRHSADDIVGKVELSMQKLIQHPGKMYPQVSKLMGMDEGSEMPGELHWEVGYFGKPQFRSALRTDGKNKALPDALKNDPKLQDEKGVTNTDTDDAVKTTPPDPLWPSGICSIIIHQIVNLELENVKGTTGSRNGREYEPAKPYGEAAEEEGGDLPNSYCTILFNDELVYKTRTKAVSQKPIFNAGTERHIRDWRNAIVTVTVRDQRHREHDPILGVVPLKLSDILETSSQVTRWYPLDGGVGFGRIRISLLFRSVETRLPPQQLGWSVGTFIFTSERIVAKGYNHHAKLKLRTGGSSGKISRSACHSLEGGESGYYWDLKSANGHGTSISLPVKFRYRSPVVFEFHVANKRKADAYAVIWLHQLIDNEDAEMDVPIYQTAGSARLTQNYITDEALASGTVPGLEDIKEIGRLSFTGRFKAGMDESHEHFVADNNSRETYETWEACLAEGVRTRVVEKELPETIKQLHEDSLTQGRDVLSTASEEEKEKWLSKEGMDWSGAFGEDPAAFVDKNGKKRREPGRDPPLQPGEDPDHDGITVEGEEEEEDSDDSDLGVQDATSSGSPTSRKSIGTMESGWTAGTGDTYDTQNEDPTKQNKRTEERKQRGLMQWKPARNLKFAKDQTIIGARKIKGKMVGGLDGRQPGVETETVEGRRRLNWVVPYDQASTDIRPAPQYKINVPKTVSTMGSTAPQSKLFEPLRIGPMKLSSRVVHAPLTRMRANDDHTIMPMAADYYSQRGCVPGTLLISEATCISPAHSGYPNVPGIWSLEQIASWKPVVESVHKAGSYIYLQLWALGRTANGDFKKSQNTGDVLAPSAIPLAKDGPAPRAMTEEEIQQAIKDFAQAAKNAIEAGFDGVELHGANGYLIDQFFQDVTNSRTDKWGGSIENRARFGLEATKAVVEAVGAQRTAIRLSPFSDFQGMRMSDPVPTFKYIVEQLRELKLAYLHLVTSRVSGGSNDVEETDTLDPFLEAYGKDSPVLLAGGFKADSARKAIDEQYKEYDAAIVFGRLYIPNPDLVYRLKHDIELTPYDRSTFYMPKSPKGYADWPFSKEWEEEQSRL